MTYVQDTKPELSADDVALIKRILPDEHRLASLLLFSFPGWTKRLLDAARAEGAAQAREEDDAMADPASPQLAVRYTRPTAHGLRQGSIYTVDEWDHETVSPMEHLTIVGLPGAYPRDWFEVVDLSPRRPYGDTVNGGM